MNAADFGEYDVIIAGGGTAGCLLANRLSADPSRRVLMLEAGPRDSWHWIHIPVGYLHCIGNPRTDWCYKTEPEPGLNGRSILYARGRVLGGCTSINGMIYMRGQAEDYDGWAESTGDDRWSWDRVLPLFRETEDHWAGETKLHGDKGNWRVEKQRLRWEILERVIEAAQQAGISQTDDFNKGTNEGVGFFEVNQKKGVRWSAFPARWPETARPRQHRGCADGRCHRLARHSAPLRRRARGLAAIAWRHPGVGQATGGGEFAGSSANPCRLQGAWHQHAEPAGELTGR